jgi:hypothetical protein
MYTYKDRYNYTVHFFYDSCFEMPGKTVFPEKRSYYSTTEGVYCSKQVHYNILSNKLSTTPSL